MLGCGTGTWIWTGVSADNCGRVNRSWTEKSLTRIRKCSRQVWLKMWLRELAYAIACDCAAYQDLFCKSVWVCIGTSYLCGHQRSRLSIGTVLRYGGIERELTCGPDRTVTAGYSPAQRKQLVQTKLSKQTTSTRSHNTCGSQQRNSHSASGSQQQKIHRECGSQQ